MKVSRDELVILHVSATVLLMFLGGNQAAYILLQTVGSLCPGSHHPTANCRGLCRYHVFNHGHPDGAAVVHAGSAGCHG